MGRDCLMARYGRRPTACTRRQKKHSLRQHSTASSSRRCWLVSPSYLRAHTRMRARTQTSTHTKKHMRMHAHTHARVHTRAHKPTTLEWPPACTCGCLWSVHTSSLTLCRESGRDIGAAPLFYAGVPTCHSFVRTNMCMRCTCMHVCACVAIYRAFVM